MNIEKIKQFFSDIESAYCWEGYATVSTVSETDNELVLSVRGSSTVEHSGDEDGIKTQVKDLVGETFSEDNFIYKIVNSNVKIEHNERFRDGDYEIYVTGTVKINKKAK